MERAKGNNPRRSTMPEPPKNAAAGGRAPPTTSSTDELHQEQSKTRTVIDSASSDTIKAECNPVLKALERGDYADARNIMTEVRLRHILSPLVHRIQCSVNFYIASKLDHSSLQIQAHLEIAVEAAKRAHLLSPNSSILFTLLYARMLLIAASDKIKCYEEVVRVCDQALSIHNPIDPAKDTLNGESHYKDSTAEQRIAYVKKELQKLIKNSKKDSSVQTKNPNKSKQATEMERKRRKDMNDEQNLGLLEKRNSDFRVYLSSFKADDILFEAISFAKKNSKWKFWACCNCDEKFVDSESYLHHLKQEHGGNLSLNMESVLPTEIDSHLVEKLVNGQWIPVDTGAVMKTIQSQSKCQLENPVDTPDALPSTPMLCSDDQNWPLSDDSERSEILEKIHDMFQLLLKHKYLTQSHLDKLVQYTMEEMQKSVQASQFLIQSPIIIRFLGASQLETILQFLWELAYVCGLNWDSTDDALDGNQGYEINDKVVSTDESLRLLLDNRSQHMPSTYVPDRDFIVSLLESWTYVLNNTKHQGREVFERLKKEWRLLQGICEEKCEYMSLKEALQQVTESICVEKYEKMEEERTGRNGVAISSSRRVELDVISTVHKEALTLNAEQFQFEETLTGVTSCFRDLECNIQDYQHQEDTCIKLAIQRQMKWLSTELCKIDAKIMRTNAYIKQLEAEIARLSVHDYRFFMFPLLWPFMRAQLEDLVGKDAAETLLDQLARQDEKLSRILRTTTGTRNDAIQTVEARTEETQAVTSFQNDKARDGATRGEVAASTVENAAVEVSWMGVDIPRTFVPLLEKALVHHPNLVVALASLPVSFRRASCKGLGRVLQIFGMVASGETDESVLEDARLILEALLKLDLDVLWLDTRFAMAKRALRHSQLATRKVELEGRIAKANAELRLRQDNHRVMLNHMAELGGESGDYSLLRSYED